MNQGEELGQYETLGSGLRSCDSLSTKLLVTAYGHVGREFKLRPFSAGSILTLRNRIEPPASTTSVERTPRKMQSTKLTPSITALGNVPNPRSGRQRKAWCVSPGCPLAKQTKPAERATARLRNRER